MPIYLLGDGDAAVPPMALNLCASCVECGGSCHYQRPPKSFRRLLVLAAIPNHRPESGAPGQGLLGSGALYSDLRLPNVASTSPYAPVESAYLDYVTKVALNPDLH